MDRSTFDSDLQALLAAANSRIPAHSLPDLPSTPALPGVPGWHEEELALWNQGEAIRQLVRTARKKLNRTQAAEILDICKNRNAGRGRESFVMLLGQRAYAEYAPQIAALLDDRDVGGHCVYTLYKMKKSGCPITPSAICSNMGSHTIEMQQPPGSNLPAAVSYFYSILV